VREQTSVKICQWQCWWIAVTGPQEPKHTRSSAVTEKMCDGLDMIGKVYCPWLPLNSTSGLKSYLWFKIRGPFKVIQDHMDRV